MLELPDALKPLAQYRQFILWKLGMRDGKQTKFPVDFRDGSVGDAHDPAIWLDATTAIDTSTKWGTGYGVGFTFTENDPFFFIDIDKCLGADNVTWSDLALEVIGRFPGVAVEVSQSGRGLHIIGASSARYEHASKNRALGMELYTSGRFVALTGSQATGSAALDCAHPLSYFVGQYFMPRVAVKDVTWTSEACAGCTAIADDDELIAKALAVQTAAGVFGGASTFKALWEADADALGRSYPDASREYDASSADAALAQHLAFWTGNNCERMLRLMRRSALVREKWDREDYMQSTITFAASVQTTFYNVGGTVDDSIAEANGAPKLRASSESQRAYATNVRAQKLVECQGDQDLIIRLCASTGACTGAKFWLDNRGLAPKELVAMTTPVTSVSESPMTVEAQTVTGYQFLVAELQKKHFVGCVYVQDANKIFTPDGSLLKQDQFNATYGGYVFQMDETGDKVTTKAWDAFVQSQVLRHPKAHTTCFRPERYPDLIIREEGRRLVNTYVPISTERRPGDAAPFLNHLTLLLPNVNDRAILLAYMAACVQHIGVKFQWAPLLQGTYGNGKSLFMRCIAFAIGSRYVHMPFPSEIHEKFNEWLFGKAFIGVEEIRIKDRTHDVVEILGLMITNERLAKRAMQQGQVMDDNRANFFFNTNHKDAIQKTKNDRRYCVFFTAQQSIDDMTRDGMDDAYFTKLYNWLRLESGYAIVANFLETYAIPDALNPATSCQRAPTTTTTHEAISASLGSIEQEIMEAVSQAKSGFAGGWISSLAIEKLLQSMNMTRAVPPNKRRDMLKALGYDWHPHLQDGRANNLIALDGGKPRLFITHGHIACNIEKPADVVRAYELAQQPQDPRRAPSAGQILKGPQI